MAMLAEKKQRSRYCLNPRGNDWAKDSNKFGQKMLEKMGWSPGKGLGANEQGSPDVLRVTYKNDAKGFGFENKGEEWLKQQVEFGSLLAELGGSKESDEVDLEKIEISRSLEQKSKETKTRVHYHKFTRGKDLSRYSAKDLSCIVGIGTKLIEKEKVKEAENKNLINSRHSVYSYFQNKTSFCGGELPPKDDGEDEKSDIRTWDSLKFVSGGVQNNSQGSGNTKRMVNENEDGENDTGNESGNGTTGEFIGDQEIRIKVKKKKKRGDREEEYGEKSNNTNQSSMNGILEGSNGTDIELSSVIVKSKKKKKKLNTADDGNKINISIEPLDDKTNKSTDVGTDEKTGIAGNTDSLDLKIKKSKRKINKDELNENSPMEVDCEKDESPNGDRSLKKKRKKKNKQNPDEFITDIKQDIIKDEFTEVDTPADGMSKKSKKKRRPEEATSDQINGNVQPEDGKEHKIFKKKKRKCTVQPE